MGCASSKPAVSSATPSASAEYSVSTSAELMTNYLQYELLDPQRKFEALQTLDGSSLLFAIGTSGGFRVVVEQSGQSRHGWSVYNLSESLIERDFAGVDAEVRSFSVAQMAAVEEGAERQIHVVMVIEAAGTSHMYLSLNNSDSDLSWTSDMPWVQAPFNALDSATGEPLAVPDPLIIANVFLSDTSSGEFVFVDTERNTSAAEPLLSRWYIDVTEPNAPVWKAHTLAADIQASSYQSCLGRAGGQFVDGIYTIGQVAGVAQFSYVPLYNPFDPSAPVSVTLLSLPDGLIPDAIAAARHSNGDGFSDLYVASQGGLYFFASSSQGDHSVGVKVASHATLLAGVSKLFAAEEEGVVTVWGLDGSDQVFYMTCPTESVLDLASWSSPLPILTGVDAISPYMDRKFVANTFFAHSGSGLLKYTKTPGTALWTMREIQLPPSSSMQDATEIQSFTTHVQVTDSTTGEVAANVEVQLTATTVTSVHINHLYYAVGPTPVTVMTDFEGTVTIVETTHELVATRFSVAVTGGPTAVAINPMDNAMQRNGALDTADKLRQATITADDGTQTPFIPADTSDDDVNKIANCNAQLQAASLAVQSTGAPTFAPRGFRKRLPRAHPVFAEPHLQGSSVLCDVGDLFRYLATGVEAVIDIAKDVASDAYYFVANIAGSAFSAILDDLEAIASAIVWVYNKTIGKLVDLVLELLAFLFGWDAILVTHKVLKKFVLLTAEQYVDDIAGARAELAQSIQALKANIAAFTPIPGLDDTTASAMKSSAGSSSAPGNLASHHFKGNASQSSTTYNAGSQSDSVLDTLNQMVEEQLSMFEDTANKLEQDVIEPFTSLSLSQITERLVAILGVELTDSLGDLGDQLLSIAEPQASTLPALLDAPLNIPILSWLYNKLTGGDQLSFLDVACLVAAVPATIMLRAANEGKAPYAMGDTVTELMLSATSVIDWNNAPYNAQTAASAQQEGELMLGDSNVDTAKSFQSLLLGASSLIGSLMQCFSSAAISAIKEQDEIDEADSELLVTMEMVRFAGSMSASAQAYNAHMFDTVPDVSKWYVSAGSIMLCLVKFKDFLRIFFAKSKSGLPGSSVFAWFGTVAGGVSLASIIYTNVEDPPEKWTASAIMKLTGNVSQKLAGVLSGPTSMLSSGSGKSTLQGLQYTFRLGFGFLMIGWPIVELAGD